ncbi:ras-interacting protein RIP3-like [Acropora millepora]|uniref:ras-interacting protein RIP3-like n=1 Tax=Acropora millepora TaxID=45264 RepID=UPI001CF346EA|nr:ras-interacting protein RIP3-like [Acropora millepora]
MKKTIDSSCALAAQEIIAFTEYNNVFPSASATQQQLQNRQQKDDPTAQQPQQLLQANSLLQQAQDQHQQSAKPIEKQSEQRQYRQLQPQQQQPQKKQQKQHQKEQQQQQQQLEYHDKRQAQQNGHQQQEHQRAMPTSQTHRQLSKPPSKNKYREEQRRCNFPDQQHNYDQQRLSPLQQQQKQKVWGHSTQRATLLRHHQSNSSYLNMLEDAMTVPSTQGATSSDAVSCLGTTRSAITSAMTTLSDYADGFRDSSEDSDEGLQDFSLDDSGVAISDSDIDDVNEMNHREDDPCADLKILTEKIARLEKENDQLKHELGVYKMTGEFEFLFQIISRC